MAYVQSDLDAIDGAIKKGVESVTFADGRQVRYRSLDEMIRVRAHIEEQISAAANGGALPRTAYATFTKD